MIKDYYGSLIELETVLDVMSKVWRDTPNDDKVTLHIAFNKMRDHLLTCPKVMASIHGDSEFYDVTER